MWPVSNRANSKSLPRRLLRVPGFASTKSLTNDLQALPEGVLRVCQPKGSYKQKDEGKRITLPRNKGLLSSGMKKQMVRLVLGSSPGSELP